MTFPGLLLVSVGVGYRGRESSLGNVKDTGLHPLSRGARAKSRFPAAASLADPRGPAGIYFPDERPELTLFPMLQRAVVVEASLWVTTRVWVRSGAGSAGVWVPGTELLLHVTVTDRWARVLRRLSSCLDLHTSPWAHLEAQLGPSQGPLPRPLLAALQSVQTSRVDNEESYPSSSWRWESTPATLSRRRRKGRRRRGRGWGKHDTALRLSEAMSQRACWGRRSSPWRALVPGSGAVASSQTSEEPK